MNVNGQLFFTRMRYGIFEILLIFFLEFLIIHEFIIRILMIIESMIIMRHLLFRT